MNLFSLYKINTVKKMASNIFFCSAEMMNKSNNATRGKNLFSKMALEEKSLTTPAIVHSNENQSKLNTLIWAQSYKTFRRLFRHLTLLI